MTGPDKIDWRDRESTVLADLYDGDRHLIMEYVFDSCGDMLPPIVLREDVTIPHPLPGVRYADGTATRTDMRR